MYMYAYVYLASSLTLFQPTSEFDDFPSLPWDAENTGNFGCTGTRETAAASDLIFWFLHLGLREQKSPRHL